MRKFKKINLLNSHGNKLIVKLFNKYNYLKKN